MNPPPDAACSTAEVNDCAERVNAWAGLPCDEQDAFTYVSPVNFTMLCTDSDCVAKAKAYPALESRCRRCLPDDPRVQRPLYTNFCSSSAVQTKITTLYKHWAICEAMNGGHDPKSEGCNSCTWTSALLNDANMTTSAGGNLDQFSNFTDRIAHPRSNETDRVVRNSILCARVKTTSPPGPLEGAAVRTAAPTKSSSSNSSSSTAGGSMNDATMYTYVGVAVIGALCSVALVLFLLRRRRRRRSTTCRPLSATGEPSASRQGVTTGDDGDDEYYDALSPTASMTWTKDVPTVREKEVEVLQLLAQGANGQVFLGVYNRRHVAIKTMLPGHHTSQEMFTIMHEIGILSRLQHPSIVQFLGVLAPPRTEGDVRFLVEYMDLGDLRDRLLHSTPQSLPWHGPDKPYIASQIVAGLVYLHAQDIIHRDLKSRNILLSSGGGAKISDFGAARPASTTHTMTRGVGTYRWMAPEVLSENQYSVAADIFSFGILLTELDTHMIPYTDVKSKKSGAPLVDTAIVSMVIAGAIQPTMRVDCPMWLQELIMQCIATDPSLRPTAHDIQRRFQQHGFPQGV
ncbi:serine/threonine protein kinase [Saprolegnia parasitica CBS 223.65]|uniref:Serine/threonine protein kinase n=1 Tax=Saprolegnia parasitica (strain CBS 223.65) TaxID=695850 RepID=A0A067BLW5_SAPPC|nr:serine/threonine protein kinase [Saprolegnia parasitica CBS 223.65]KDO19494.1 serine/threonine protein kinase [Saprolegnia parasitica CBS 223.65]|eukprot:XP_012209798.1 serine/threonine protein kinase [Saprolegnia parasitica CBS 223.65]